MAGIRKTKHGGFTVIELLVVVAIIALLVAILMPSLQQARQHAKTVMCSSNLHHIGLAVANYLYGSRGTYPASYVYPHDEYGEWSIASQTNQVPYGYLHWSHFLYTDGQVPPTAFQCPNYDDGGAPRTNPGLQPDNWAPGQVDAAGQSSPNPLEDKQAPRMAYAANAAIMPRNKFTTALSGGQRVNTFVRENQITRAGDTILATEYLNNWRALGVPNSGLVLSKSHRPINPFWHLGSAYNEYKAPINSPGFMYGRTDDQRYYGLLEQKEIRAEESKVLDYTSGRAQINAVGRHHPTNDAIFREKFGGEANFLFVDAHAEAMTALKTMEDRKWGDRYFSLNGENEIINMSTMPGTRPGRGGRP